MKELELFPILIAGTLGAAILYLTGQMFLPLSCASDTDSGTCYLLPGFAIGAGVQIGVRLIGVS